MGIEKKIFLGFVFIFTLVYTISAGAYYMYFKDVLTENQRLHANLINTTLHEKLMRTIESNRLVLKNLEKDGDIALMYDKTEWLSMIGKGKVKRRFEKIFEHHPHIQSVRFFNKETLLFQLHNANNLVSDAVYVDNFAFSLHHSRVEVGTNIATLLQEQLAAESVFGLLGVFLDCSSGQWIISDKEIAPYLDTKAPKENVLVKYQGQELMPSTCLSVEETGFCLKSLLSYQHYEEALHGMILRILLLYVFIALVTYWIAKRLSLHIIRPIKALEDAAKRFTAGDFSPIKLSFEGEIATTIQTFNAMGQRIENFTQELQHEVKLRTEDLVNANAKLEHLAITDSLTGLYNRAKTDTSIQAEVNRYHRSHRPFCLVLLDLDDFKKVNDTYGHQAGDTVLKGVARLLRKHTRKVDTVGRWGGEEFLIVLPETTLKGALVVAQTIRQALAAHHFEDIGHITASIGVVEYAKDETINALFSRADTRLYEAKNSGKNKIKS